MSAAVHRIRSDYEIEMERTRFFVPLRYTLTVLSILAALALWGICEAVPLLVDMPVVYGSYSTGEITRIEIDDRVYTPDSDPKWKTHKKQALAGRYEFVHVK